MLHGCDHKLVNYPRALACHMVFRALFTPSFSGPPCLPLACLGSATHKPSGQSSEGWLIVSRSLGCSPDHETLDYTLGLKCRSCTLPSRESPKTSTRWILPTTLQAHYQNFLQQWASSVLPNSPRNPMSEAPTWKSPHGPRVEASCLKLGFQGWPTVGFIRQRFFLSNTYWPSIHGDINQPRYPLTDSNAIPFRVSALEVTLAPPGFQEELKGSLRSNIWADFETIWFN